MNTNKTVLTALVAGGAILGAASPASAVTFKGAFEHSRVRITTSCDRALVELVRTPKHTARVEVLIYSSAGMDPVEIGGNANSTALEHVLIGYNLKTTTPITVRATINGVTVATGIVPTNCSI